MKKEEIRKLKETGLCSIATVRPSKKPHLVLVNYVKESMKVYIRSGIKSVKVQNLLKNNWVALLEQSGKRYVIVEGKAEIIKRGKRFNEIKKFFDKKRPDLMQWETPGSVYIEITPRKVLTSP